ncbi:MAG: VWA domain-containing protein, partial [Caldilineaceae bacterium]|nr:VWA domain-containing protein [Caldilineaceae bacterium]
GPITPVNGGTITVGSPATFNNQALSRYGANYYSATPGANCPVISVSFNTDSGPAFYHVVTHKGNALDSHFESSASPWTQSFFNDGITRVVAIAGATNNSAQADISIQCLNPVIDIRMPNSGAVAKVGPFDGPGKFLAQVLVTNGDPKGPVVAGLTVSDFKARVNGVNALITAGGFVQEQYWLVVQAPNQGSNGVYDLEIRLEESGTATTIATDTNAASVEYTPDNVDQVLVIDRSGSMASDGKMQAARDAANFYIDITRNSDGLSLVPFDHNVSPAPFAMQLVDLFVRNNAHNFINALGTGGATSIGDGMNEAVNQRTGSPTGNPLCSYVLLSDGMENSSLYWSDVAAAVQATACPVTTIAFGSAADETLMEQIATTTGGSFFYNDVYVSAVNAAGVDAAAAINAADTALDLADTYEYANALAEGRQRLLDEKGTLPGNAAGGPNNAEREHRVLIDGSVKEALFALKWDQGGCQEFCPQLALRLVSPDGKEYTEKSIAYTFKNTYSGHLGWRIPSPVAGEWRIFVSYADGSVAPNGAAYKVIVSADSLLTAHLLLPAKRKLTGLFMPIFALVSGEKPIGDASVRAVVIAPDGTRTVVPLYDDGEHDDGLPGDGFYGGVYKRVNQAEPVQPIREEGGEKLPDPRDEGSYRVELQVYHAQFQRQALGSFSVLEAPDANDNRLPDTYEQQNGLTSPDGDNDLDWLDNYSEYLLGTDANNSDTDGSGENDGSEVEKQKNPFSEKDDSIAAPAFVDATADVNSVRIHFDVKPGYHHMILYRAESPNGPWQLRDQEVPPTGEYIDKEVNNGQGYWYKMMAVDEKNHRSAVIASQGVVPSADPFAPEARILINNGAPTTADLLVKLSFVPYEEDDYYGDIAEMKVSNLADLSDVEWQPFTKEMAWQLAETQPGEVTQVYARFRDKAGNESLLETARIRYEPSGATTCVDPNPRAGAVKFSDVPVQFVRTAAQLLADMRGGPMAPGWEKAHFAELVRELYRPDIEGVAYYEFQVLNGEEKPAGFIIVATGGHDHPIPHWNYEGETPTQHVACEAAKNNKKVAKFFKLDTLSYAGEDENGELAAMPGTPLIKVSGLTMDMLDKEQEISSSEWTPDQETQSDDEAGDIGGTLTESGPTPPENLTLEGWDSWQELKKGYGATYAVFIEALKREAAEDWETDQLAREHGEGLFKGNTYDISLLIPGTPQVQMSGEGAGYVDFEVISESGQPAVLRIHVKDAKPGEALPLIATVDYATVNAASVSNGMAPSAGQETITFAVRDTPTTVPGNGTMNKIYLPLVNGGGQPQVSAASTAAVNGAWSNWHYFWAGSHNDQRLYNQIEKHTGPNTSTCWSGCGGTAWAMLFGWADKQAANGNSYWASRWGLYRQNGGKGSDAVAPRTMDSGVMNMTREIRNDVGTWCWGDSGPTNPWDMDNASNYFSGRTGTRLSTHYNVLGISEDRLRNYARDSIVDRNTPAVIGTGWL